MAPDTAEGITSTRASGGSAIFRSEYEGYQRITDADYLEHSLLFGFILDLLQSQSRKLRILDLGCGDAVNLCRVLRSIKHKLISYTGIDMSETAIAQAREAVRGAVGDGCKVDFELKDMLSFLKSQSSTQFDVVLAAFSVHHLSSDDKKEALKEIWKCLEPKAGLFVMADPFRQKGEDLAAYRLRATKVGETWTHMPEDQRARFIQHMQDYDIVEEQEFFEQAGSDAGFKRMDILCQGQKGLRSCITAFRL